MRNLMVSSGGKYSVLGSAASIGAMVGALKSGHISDIIGGKGGMWISSVFCLAGWLAVYFAKEPCQLISGRLNTGYGMGLFSYMVLVFISKIAPKNLRGGLATLNQLMIISEVSFTFILETVVSWRTLTLIAIVPCFVLFFGLFLIPESPRWLVKNIQYFCIVLYIVSVKHGKNKSKEYVSCRQRLVTRKSLNLHCKSYVERILMYLLNPRKFMTTLRHLNTYQKPERQICFREDTASLSL